MAYISIILASILTAGSPLLTPMTLQAEGQMEQMVAQKQLGKAKIAQVRASFDKGEYKQFLNELDVSYKNADLSNLIEVRKKPIPTEFQAKWEERFTSLQKERNAQVLLVLPENDNSIFAEKVRTMTAEVSTEPQEKAVSKLNTLIALAPKTGVNEDENKLIDLDLEYEYKLLHAQLPQGHISPSQMDELQLALRMEKMEKMVEASKSFKDHSLKTAVGLAASNLDARLARNLDGVDLNTLIKDKVQPSTEVEEKVLAIMAIYQGHFNDLMKELEQSNK